jgi:hypothetical protein
MAKTVADGLGLGWRRRGTWGGGEAARRPLPKSDKIQIIRKGEKLVEKNNKMFGGEICNG